MMAMASTGNRGNGGAVADSHYISRCLLRNWAHPTHHTLNYFAFADDSIKTISPKSMYVSDTPYPADVEKWLDRNVETPLGEYLARCKRAIEASADVKQATPDPSARERKALTLTVLLQPGRTAIAVDGSDTHLIDAIRKGDAFIERLIEHYDQISDGLVVNDPTSQLFFPSLGLVGLPLLGGLGMFLPLAPWLCTMRIPKAALDGSLELFLRTTGVTQALSAGLQDDRIVLPPLRAEADDEQVAALVRECRASAHKLHQLIAQSNERIGVDLAKVWRPKKPI
jgi:hypothetical protein